MIELPEVNIVSCSSPFVAKTTNHLSAIDHRVQGKLRSVCCGGATEGRGMIKLCTSAQPSLFLKETAGNSGKPECDPTKEATIMTFLQYFIATNL